MMKTIGSLIIVLFWSGTVFAQATLTPASISDSISRIGASATLYHIYHNNREWAELLSGISSGSPSWIKIGLRLHDVSDAGTSESIILAIGEALEYKPINVLEIAIPKLGVEAICSGPDIDDSRYNSYALAIKAIENRKRRLKKITTVRLMSLRNQCISDLEKSKIGIARFYGVETK
jgi:hypothetical protein